MGFSFSDIGESLGLGSGASDFLGGSLLGGILGGGGGSLLGGVTSSGLGSAGRSRDQAAEAALAAQREAIEEQRRQFDLTRGDLQPFLEGGLTGQSQLLDILGGQFDPSQDPLIQQQLDLSAKGAGRFASAGGSLGTGGFQKDLLRGTSNVFNNRINQLLALRSGGQGAATATGQFGAQKAGQIGAGLQNIGNIQAGAELGRANSIENLLNTGIGAGIGILSGGL